MEKIVDEKKFFTDHKKQVHHRAQKDIFFIWLLVMFISVISAYFVLNMGAGSPTGFVTANEDPEANLTLLLSAFMVLFVVVLITALIYIGITQKDHPFFF
jgi:uncharacterized membrane protein YhaH (DUF805 family)